MNKLQNIFHLASKFVVIKKLKQIVKIINFEAFIWIFALVYLAFFNDPFAEHFTICPLSNLGFEHCPGCGLGNSISLLFRGYFYESFQTHLLGIPAVIIILHRIYVLIKNNLKKLKSQLKLRSNYA